MLFLLAAGLTLVFGIMDMINLAHGSLYMIGALHRLAVVEASGLFCSALSVPSSAPLWSGVALEVTLLRWLYRRSHLSQVLATFAVILIANEIVRMIWGSQPILPQHAGGHWSGPIEPGIPLPGLSSGGDHRGPRDRAAACGLAGDALARRQCGCAPARRTARWRGAGRRHAPCSPWCSRSAPRCARWRVRCSGPLLAGAGRHGREHPSSWRLSSSPSAASARSAAPSSAPCWSGQHRHRRPRLPAVPCSASRCRGGRGRSGSRDRLDADLHADGGVLFFRPTGLFPARG